MHCCADGILNVDSIQTEGMAQSKRGGLDQTRCRGMSTYDLQQTKGRVFRMCNEAPLSYDSLLFYLTWRDLVSLLAHFNGRCHIEERYVMLNGSV